MNKADLKKEIIDLLLGKVKAVVSRYREKWEADFALLFEVRTAMETLEGKKDELIKESSGLRPLVHKELGRRNDIDRAIHKLHKTITATRKKADALVERLTMVEGFNYPSPMLNFISGEVAPSYVDLIKQKEELVVERKKLDKKRK